VAACIPSNLGVPFTVVLRDGSYRDHPDGTWRGLRLGCHPVTSMLRVAVA
jgi:hypothetical protein